VEGDYILSVITKYSEAYELSHKPHKGLSATSQPHSETKQWLIASLRRRNLEMTNRGCELQVKWFQLCLFESCFTALSGIEATYGCVLAYTLTWRRSAWWLYRLHTQICDIKVLVRKQSRDGQNVWQIYLKCFFQRTCDLSPLNSLHVNGEWSDYELDGIAEEIIMVYRTIPNLMWLQIQRGSTYKVAPNTRWLQIQGGSIHKVAPNTKWLHTQVGSKYKVAPNTRWLQTQGGSKYKVAPNTRFLLLVFHAYFYWDFNF
jgi:uncharacterized protein YaiE (UPF0345 family)